MTVTNEVTDQVGRKVEAGDWIAYGVGRGEISTALVLGFVDTMQFRWDYRTQTQVQEPWVKIQIKSPQNSRASLIEAGRAHFVKIDPLEEGAEFGNA